MALWNSFAALVIISFLAWSRTATTAVTAQPSCPLISPPSEFPSTVNLPTPVPAPEFFDQLENLIQSYVSTASVPQYAVSVVLGNRTVFTSGLGNTPFLIGSGTKTFVAMGALMLREQGRLSLDDPLKKFLPDFTIINPYCPHDITLRELMLHVSGLPRELCINFFVQNQTEEECPVLEADVLKRISEMQLIHPPWSRVPDYSNLGVALLAHAWEKATSPLKSWTDFIVENIFDPLQMKDSGLNIPGTDVIFAGRNSGGAPELNVGWVAPAGAMFSSSNDLAKFLIFVLNAEPPLLTDASIQEWTRSSFVFPDRKAGFSLGWDLTSVNATPEFLITRDGDITGYASFFGIHPPTQTGVSVLFTVDPSGTPAGTPDALGLAILNDLIPAVEILNAGTMYPPYAGLYQCVSLNDSIHVMEGSTVNVSFTPDVGLYAMINISRTATADGTVEDSVIKEVSLVVKNATENSFWTGESTSCDDVIQDISARPSPTMSNVPNVPGSHYYLEILFDLAMGTLVSIDAEVLCKKAGHGGN